MRPLRLLLLLAAFVALPVLTFFSLLYSHPRHATAESTKFGHASSVGAFFSFHTPSSLFPPSAVISLTDDNSTFFLARPASFGPSLPSNGLSGRLWVGSGFGDDTLKSGGVVAGAEGELGCSDVLGWSDGKRPGSGIKNGKSSNMINDAGRLGAQSAASTGSAGHRQKRDGVGKAETLTESTPASLPREEDGTDDHLHHPLSVSLIQKPPKLGQSANSNSAKDCHHAEHADIQSIQESAEIAGKVVLLSRGGCGFLEKVKWVQRRGGVALIVGDDSRGGPLVTMYARGDTSNISVPSLFTSHTTAHLLSSLIPRGGQTDGAPVTQNSGPSSDSPKSAKSVMKNKIRKENKSSADRPTFTSITEATKLSSVSYSTVISDLRSDVSAGSENLAPRAKKRASWLRSFASALCLRRSLDSPDLQADSRRPPSSGRINWVISETWADEPPNAKKKNGKSAISIKSKKKSRDTSKSGSEQNAGDDFVIGVQDWRDPDLVGSQDLIGHATRDTSESLVAKSSPRPSIFPDKKSGNGQSIEKGLAGGSITPSSGEYEKPGHRFDSAHYRDREQEAHLTNENPSNNQPGGDGSAWLGQLFERSPNQASSVADGVGSSTGKGLPPGAKSAIEDDDDGLEAFNDHEGLWVTITPTAVSTSPFFDTLLVLVVSPLVTLTIVYAMLLIRSRIRRRRWRAPKSVVDRLPVRTYHTMPYSPGSAHSQETSPISSSATSPLLRSDSQSTKPRPRSWPRTTSGITETPTASVENMISKAHLVRGGRLVSDSSPRKPYSGKQIECVVCLEEYVDGQSRVMSLPCGHEFHADCM